MGCRDVCSGKERKHKKNFFPSAIPDITRVIRMFVWHHNRANTAKKDPPNPHPFALA